MFQGPLDWASAYICLLVASLGWRNGSRTTWNSSMLCVTDAPWLLQPGTFGPGNRMVEIGSNFSLSCMMPHRWREAETHWFVYFILPAIYCQFYPTTNKSVSNCSAPFDLDRFSVYRVQHTLALHVQRAVREDIGFYTCSRPTYFHHSRPQGHVALVGIIRKYLERIKYKVKICDK